MLFGIFIYDGVEPIDLATYGVLSMARRIAPEIEICTVAPRAGPVALANGLKVSADFGIADAPPCDLVIVTGGLPWSPRASMTSLGISTPVAFPEGITIARNLKSSTPAPPWSSQGRYRCSAPDRRYRPCRSGRGCR